MEKTRKERIETKKSARRMEQFKESNVVVKKGLAFVSTTLIVGSLSLPSFSAVASANEMATTSQKKIEGTTNQSTPVEGSQVAVDSAASSETVSSANESSSVDSSVTESTENNSNEAVESSEATSTNSSSESVSSTETPTTTEDTKVSEEPLSEDEVVEQDITEVQAPAANYAVAQSMMMSRSLAPQAFLAQVAESARTIANANDLYASVMIAQAILESGWGNSALASAPNYNLFGIKGNYNGQSVAMKTLEDDGKGNYYEIVDYFRKYPSYYQSLQDYANVIKNGPSWNSNYYSGAWKSNTSSYRDATAWLQGRYATDTSYASKLNGVIVANNLTQYDTPGSGTGGGGTTTPDPTPTPGNEATYTVKSGDTLWGIANKHGVSVANLKSWNKLTSDAIFVGQKLIVKSGGSTTTPTPNPTPTPDPTPSTGTSYTVKSGDTLWGIANKHGVSVANLKSWNKLTSDAIFVGQKLIVKSGGSTTTPTPNPTPTPDPTPSTGTSYTVKSGDSLWGIANKQGVSVANLKSWNKLSSDMIFVGQKLIVKSGGGSSTTTPTPNPTPNPTPSTGGSYTVKSGDSLWGIANKHGVSVANLKSWNKLSSDMIFVGQKLVVKSGGGSSTTTPTPNPTPNPTPSTGGSYTVKSGDSLWNIANKHGVSVANLKSWNKLSSDMIFVGQKLVVKSGGSTSTGSSSSSTTTSSKSYKVASGDSLWSIANKHKTTVANLKALNNLKSDIILVGQTLTVAK